MATPIELRNRRPTIDAMETIGQRIRARRKALGLNQTALAEQVGIDQSTVSDIERGSSFEASTLMALSAVLMWSTKKIMTGEDEESDLTDEEALMISAHRQMKAAASKIKKTGDTETKRVSSPMSKPKVSRKKGVA